MILRLILAVMFTLLASGCASNYQLTDSTDSLNAAKLTVRSPAGRSVSASIFTIDDECKLKSRKLVDKDSDSRALKSFKIKAGEVQLMSFRLQGNNFHGYSCDSTVAFLIEPNKHYVVNMIAEPTKKVCKNKITDWTDKQAKLDIYVLAQNDVTEQDSPTEWMCDKQLVSAEMIGENEYKSPIIFNNTSFSAFGPIHSSSEQTEK